MNDLAFEKAKGCLRLARRALTSLESVGLDPQQFDEHWTDFLTQWKRTYTKLQQAAKTTPQEMQWFGAMGRQRRHDPLLRWLYEARNDEEHGVIISAESASPRYHLRFDKPPNAPIQIIPGGDGPAKFMVGGEEVEPAIVEPGISVMHEVTEYDGKRKVPPPTTHLGKPFDGDPIIAAGLGYQWLEQVMALAEATHRP